MRVRKRPKTELVGCYVWRVVFVLAVPETRTCVNSLQPRGEVSGGGVRYMAVRSVRTPTPGGRFPMQLESTYINLLPPLAKKIYILTLG
jgi:hypothetical protein